MSRIDYDKYVALPWQISVFIPDRPQWDIMYIPNFDACVWLAKGIKETLNHLLDLEIEWYQNLEGGGRPYHDKKSEHEYIRIFSPKGNGILLRDDSQIAIGTYVDYSSAGYAFKYEKPDYNHGVRILGEDIIYNDWWITGNYFYMTNDDKLDSMELVSINRSTVVEFVPLEKRQK